MDWHKVSKAISDCDTKRLTALLSGRKRPSWNDYHGSGGQRPLSSPPLLHMAALAQRNALEMTKILVQAGMDINVQDDDGTTVLHAFLLGENKSLWGLTGILDLGCDPLIQDSVWNTALHTLVGNDAKHDLNPYIETLLSFVDESHRTSYVNAMNMQGKSAIFYASIYGSASTVRKLLDLHADPFVGNPTGGSSLLHRVLNLDEKRADCDDENDLIRTITKLLELGCGDPMARDEWGRTALHHLVRNDPKYHLNGCIDALVAFVDEPQRTSYINAIDAEGKSAIFYASYHYSSVSRVGKLLDLHADPLLGNPSGSSILHKVITFFENSDDDEYDLVNTVEKLLELGFADPMARDEWGRTALHCLLINDPKYHLNECIDALLSYVDESERLSYVNAINAEGKSAILLRVR